MSTALAKPANTQQVASSTTRMDTEKSIVTFYDIASGPPIQPFAPNPWKTRYVTAPCLLFAPFCD